MSVQRTRRIKAVSEQVQHICPDNRDPVRQFTVHTDVIGIRNWRLSIANTKARHWTWYWASSIHLQSSQLISLRSILMVFSRHLFDLPSGCFPKGYHPTFCMHSLHKLRSPSVSSNKISLTLALLHQNILLNSCFQIHAIYWLPS